MRPPPAREHSRTGTGEKDRRRAITSYYRLTTPDDEITGTEDAIRASVQLYKDGGGRRFYISGPFASPPGYRPPERRRIPVRDDQICALCFRRSGEHTGTDLHCPEVT